MPPLRYDASQLMRVSAIIAAGGRGTRLGSDRPKQFLEIGGRSILDLSVSAVASSSVIGEIVVALPADHLERVRSQLRSPGKPVAFVAGGRRRQDSVARALARVSAESDIVVVHDAARPFVSAALIDRTIAAGAEHGAAIAALPVRDTVKQATGDRHSGSRPIAATLPREDIFLAQTPQAFRRDVLVRAFAVARNHGGDATDEATLAERAGCPVYLVEGEPGNVKITTAEDLAWARQQLGAGAAPPPSLRVGTGYDLHRLVAGRPLILGGVRIPFETGLEGHSDADILCHAVTDAVLGAAAAGDIGRLFPDTDPRWKGADSVALLAAAVAHLHRSGCRVVNVDATIIAERPRLLPHLDAMRENLARALEVSVTQVSVKGKTNEQVDSLGRGEAMACHAVALVAAR
jgi:2-C-methyl-D-erythritol 4-phosphate cytidylyltransferase / 2-C-methyl-D-erythritol 2,4-cyclodiphosphate synthase